MPDSAGNPAWDIEGIDWPHRAHSTFVRAGGLVWHVQRIGEGPVALLVHGTGAATHSWRDFAPLLAQRFTVVMMDLPGHGFTRGRPAGGFSLPAMSRALAALVNTLGITPALAVGHSAGAAILARACLDGHMKPELLVGLNAALKPFDGVAGAVFPPLARLLFLNPFMPRLFSWMADDRAVTRLIRDTGSQIDSRGLALYERLMRCPGHTGGALGMMANWNLAPLVAQLPALPVPLLLLAGDADKAIAPAVSAHVCERVPGARLISLPRLGHLAHEEAPSDVLEAMLCGWDERPPAG